MLTSTLAQAHVHSAGGFSGEHEEGRGGVATGLSRRGPLPAGGAAEAHSHRVCKGVGAYAPGIKRACV